MKSATHHPTQKFRIDINKTHHPTQKFRITFFGLGWSDLDWVVEFNKLMNTHRLITYFALISLWAIIHIRGNPTQEKLEQYSECKQSSLATIDADGIFRLYSHSLGQQANWSIEWSSSNDRCSPKGFCGVNS